MSKAIDGALTHFIKSDIVTYLGWKFFLEWKILSQSYFMFMRNLKYRYIVALQSLIQ